MKQMIALLLALLLAIPALAGCGKEEELGPWTMPQVDTKPTPVPPPPSAAAIRRATAGTRRSFST